MGEIKDAIDTLTDLKAEFAEAGIYRTQRSISTSAMEGTANFPVLVDDSISLDDSILVSRAAEKKYASFLLTVLTMNPFLEVEKGQTPSASEYLKQFHQNARVKSATRGAHLNLIDFLKESYDGSDMDYSIMESEAIKMAYSIYEGVTRSIPQDKNVLLNYTLEEVTTPDTLNERFRVSMESKKGGKNGNNSNNQNTSNPGWGDTFNTTNQYHIDNLSMDTDGGTVKVGKAQNVIKVNASPKVTVTNGDRGNNNQIRMNVRDRGTQWKPLTDNECKKANDLVPTLLHIRVYPIDKYTREELTPIDFIMGVKATLHPIPLDELSRMVVTGMRNENMVFNFIRWTTGEIKFFKDFLFAIDTLKMDAKDSGHDVTGWRPALKRRKNLSNSRLRLSKNSVLPNATIVVSQAGIEHIRDTYGYDLSDERIMNRMMDVYFLLGFVIVNPVNQRVTFKFDGIDFTDTYTFDTLKRENQSDDKAFKNMMKMLGRSM